MERDVALEKTAIKPYIKRGDAGMSLGDSKNRNEKIALCKIAVKPYKEKGDAVVSLWGTIRIATTNSTGEITIKLCIKNG